MMEMDVDVGPPRDRRRNYLELWLTALSSRTLIRTRDYLEVFARFKQKENIEAVERILNSHAELELFERSQLGMIEKHSSSRGATNSPRDTELMAA